MIQGKVEINSFHHHQWSFRCRAAASGDIKGIAERLEMSRTKLIVPYPDTLAQPTTCDRPELLRGTRCSEGNSFA
jgi:hypothetical protein